MNTNDFAKLPQGYADDLRAIVVKMYFDKSVDPNYRLDWDATCSLLNAVTPWLLARLSDDEIVFVVRCIETMSGGSHE